MFNNDGTKKSVK